MELTAKLAKTPDQSEQQQTTTTSSASSSLEEGGDGWVLYYSIECLSQEPPTHEAVTGTATGCLDMMTIQTT